MQDIHWLNGTPLFEGLDPGQLLPLLGHSMKRTFPANESLIAADQKMDALWIVRAGTVKIFRYSSDGREHILYFCSSGQVINPTVASGEVQLLAGASAVAITTQAYLLPLKILLPLLDTHPILIANLNRILSRQLQTLANQAEDLSLHPVVMRLARFLFRQAHTLDMRGMGITRTALAAHLGTTPQTISVSLRELEVTGAIAFDRHRIQLVDMATLREFAQL